MMMEQVVLVDERDRAIGTMEKLKAHELGILHRAFSVLLFNERGELLLQQRAATKYHSGGLWTNTCCSHPRLNENIAEAAERRLKEEMGIDLRPQFLYSFIYKAALSTSIIEHEFDHVLIGTFDEPPIINPREVQDWRFANLQTLAQDITDNPDDYTVWFKLIMSSYYGRMG